ncbi:hypothetical protein MUB24_18730 [Lederbergia sp. NSJ-179]|uniref:hypothetical protein n=1 Tax=Lederbergia sp. NSJ-179 TaxID=2931402 RepID=UPI001FD0BCD9|nr:hypothetical protein [Lederbergia sp. NSJ-179]MCJ7842876.1 hypothetical protein [Lederbergia sp. NSJ-179]
MTSLAKVLNENAIYNNEKLSNFIKYLEEKYIIKDEVIFFNQLVNFSQNNFIPLHGWFKYREGYSHTLVREMINRFTVDTEKEFIVDPFCGAGTTLVEAAVNNFDSMGVDVNPMSVAVTNAKTNSYSKADIEEIKLLIEEIPSIKLIEGELTDYEDIQQYFREDNFRALLAIKEFVNNISNPSVKELFFSGFLSIVEDSSDRKRDGNGLKKSLSKVTSVIHYYYEKMKLLWGDIGEYSLANIGRGYFGSATQLDKYVREFSKEINKKPGLIVFSPPYANSFDYFESYKMELRMGDFIPRLGVKGLSELRRLAIRSFVSAAKEPIEVDEIIDLMAIEIEEAIPLKEAYTGKKDGRTRKVPQMIRGYFHDMGKVLEKCSKVLESGHKCCIVVDQSSYLGKIVPTDLFLAYLGEQVGFKVKEVIICRKAKTSGQQLQKYPYLAESLRESIVVLEKK